MTDKIGDTVAIRVRLDTAIMALEAAFELLPQRDFGPTGFDEIEGAISTALTESRRAERLLGGD